MDYFPPLNGNLADPNRPHINANLGTGVNGSMPDALGYHAMMMSLLAVIDGSGIARDADDFTVLRQAIEARIASGLPAGIAYLGVEQLFTKAQGSSPVVLADDSPVAIDTDLSNYFTLALTASRTLANPTNIQPGRPFAIRIQQPAGGNCGLSFGTNWLFENDEAPSNTTTANAVDLLIGIGLPDDKVFAHMKLNIL